MRRSLRHLLIALALLFAQQSAQLHGLSHLGHDLQVAALGGDSAPPIGHPAGQCLAYHAVDSALSFPGLAFELPQGAPPSVVRIALPLPHPPRIVFDSRAPPAFS